MAIKAYYIWPVPHLPANSKYRIQWNSDAGFIDNHCEWQLFLFRISKNIAPASPEFVSAEVTVLFNLKAIEVLSQKLALVEIFKPLREIVILEQTRADQSIRREFAQVKHTENFAQDIEQQLTLQLSLRDLAIIALRKAIGAERLRNIACPSIPETLAHQIQCPYVEKPR